MTVTGLGNLSFPRSARIIKTDDFSSVFNFRKRISGHFLVMHYQYNQLKRPRLGLAMTKKITFLSANRNYMKRVLRELFRGQQNHLRNLDLVIRAHKTFDNADFLAVEKEFKSLISKLNLQIEQDMHRVADRQS